MPGRRPIIQITERPLQSKTRLKVSMPESSIIPESSGHYGKVIPVSHYTIQQTMSECDSISRTIRRKGMHDIRWGIPAYMDPVHRHPPKPTDKTFTDDS